MAEEKEKAKVIDIGEWKKAHGLAVAPYTSGPNPGETQTDVFISKFLTPEIAKNMFTTVKRPT